MKMRIKSYRRLLNLNQQFGIDTSHAAEIWVWAEIELQTVNSS